MSVVRRFGTATLTINSKGYGQTGRKDLHLLALPESREKFTKFVSADMTHELGVKGHTWFFQVEKSFIPEIEQKQSMNNEMVVLERMSRSGVTKHRI